MRHEYWGIGCLASLIAGFAFMAWIIAGSLVWPDTLAPIMLMLFSFLLAAMCASRITSRDGRK